MRIKGKNVLVVGMLASGISACRLLEKLGASVRCYDDDTSLNTPFENYAEAAVEKIFFGLDMIVISPAIPNNHLVIVEGKKRKIKIISELELGLSCLKCAKIIVTGTNGKTTTVCMLEKLISNMGLSVKSVGNIGYPASQLVLDEMPLDYAVVEASSFQLEYCSKLHADIAVILNIAPDHLDRYPSYSDYIKAKERVLLNQTEKNFAVLNYDDVRVRNMAAETKAKVIWFSLRRKDETSPVILKDKYFIYNGGELCHVRESRIRGDHNKYDFLAAMNVGAIINAKKENLLNLYRDFALPPHRIEYVMTIDGKGYYNDSKSTNISACKSAIESIEGRLGLILGGSDKNEDYCEFFESISERVKRIAVTGANAEKIYAAGLKMGYADIRITSDLREAIEYLRFGEVDNILFSPSSASFDRYRNYAERGESFKRLVYEIKI